LSAAEFEQVFGMNKDAFDKLPAWKQIALKRKTNLF
jgi:hypothetical protein